MATIGNHATCDASRQSNATRGPVSRLLHPILLFLVSISAATGCTAMNDADEPDSNVFKPMQSVAEAKAQLAAWFTSSTAITDAVRKLTASGFTCETTIPLSPDAQSSVVCSCLIPTPKPRFVPPPRKPDTWTVILNSKDGSTVSNFQASRSSGEP